MRNMLGAFMHDFRDCKNFRRIYPGLDKGKVNVVELPDGRVVAKYDRVQDNLGSI